MGCLYIGLGNNSAGSLDKSFGEGGKVIIRTGEGGSTFAASSLIVALIFDLFLALQAVAGMKTDLQEEGLIGPMRVVKIETAQFSNQSSQWVEGSRGLSATITYDVRGNRIEGKSEDTAKTVYTYDAQGRVIEQITCDAVGCFDKIAYTYDPYGNLIEERFYYPVSSSIKLRLVHTYDKQGRRTQTESYDAHDPGLGIEKTGQTYDANGNILELTTYYTEKVGDPEERPIPPPSKVVYTYEWDAHGNWVKQTQTLCTAESGRPISEPSLVVYRTITYYSETKVQ